MTRLVLLLALAAPAAAQVPPPGPPPPSGRDAPAPPETAPILPPRPDPGPTGASRPTTDATEPLAVPPAPQPERLNASVQAFVEGIWELAAVSELPPASEDLVFARLRFEGDRMTVTTVYRDPDDGDLAGRTRRDRFRVADGQLVVRDGLRTRLYDVAPDDRDASRMTVRDVLDRITMQVRRVEGDVERDASLYGTWQAAPPAHREVLTLAFRPDGRVTGFSGDDALDADYLVAGAYVILDNRDTFRYTVSGTHLVLERGGEMILLTRADP